jgi:hypothetical protein
MKAKVSFVLPSMKASFLNPKKVLFPLNKNEISFFYDALKFQTKINKSKILIFIFSKQNHRDFIFSSETLNNIFQGTSLFKGAGGDTTIFSITIFSTHKHQGRPQKSKSKGKSQIRIYIAGATILV